MSFLDLPLDELRAYRPSVAEPADFDAFWASTLSESRALATTPALVRYDSGLKGQENLLHDVVWRFLEYA